MSTTLSDFKIEKILGRGSFGSVFLVTRKKDNKIYALKTVILEKLSKKEQENSVNEVRILASINHPNVIGYKEAFWNDKESSLNIVMEYADDGDLQTKIQKMKKEGTQFSENLIWSYAIQMIEGLKALHDKKIMHRDLKSANIFLVKDKHQCKLGDMNVSKVIKDKVLLTQTGTPYYASPEVWNDEPYSYKSDLWSIGCVIYELCSLRPPFQGKDLDELYINVCKGKVHRINQIYSDDLWEMIKMLLQVDVNKRVNCDLFLKNKLIIRKKNELKQKNKDFNYIDNKLERNNNNGILLSTIKFSNIGEIKAQLPKNKNYNNENEDYINQNAEHIDNDYQNVNNKFKKLDNNFSNKNNNLIQNYPTNIHIDNNNNFKSKNNRNNHKIIGKNNENINYSINRINSAMFKEIYQGHCNYLSDIYRTENEEEKYDIKLKQNIISQKILSSNNKIHKNNSKRQFTLNEYSSLRNVRKINPKICKERFKTEQQKDKDKLIYIKIKHKSNRANLINSIPNSIKRTITSRQKIPKLKKEKKNEKQIRFKAGNYSNLKLEENKSISKHKYSHISKTNSITEIRSKTPSLFDKNIYKLSNDIYDINNFKIKNQNSEYQKNIPHIRNNKKLGNLSREENALYNYFNNNNISNKNMENRCKSKTNLSINQNLNILSKKDVIKKIIQKRKIMVNKERPSSAVLSKRIFDNNNLNNNKNISLNFHYDYKNQDINKNLVNIPKSQIFHTSNSNYNINYYKNSKSFRLNNKSARSINKSNDMLNYNYSPIKKRNTYINNKFKYNCDNIYNSIESDNNMSHNYSNNPHKRFTTNDNCEININRIIKKINNTRNSQQKRVFEKNKERIKRSMIPNRDLTESELMMILNSMKGKENYKNKKKSLNLSLNDNIGPNTFLKHIRNNQHLNTNNTKLNNQFYINNINNSIIKTLERNKGAQIYNNFYSINNIGNSNIPVKVINVYIWAVQMIRKKHL